MKRLLIALGLLVGLAAPAAAQAPCFVRVNGVSFGCVFGTITLTGPLLKPDGTINLPGDSWTNATSSGWYRAGSGDFRFSLAGVDFIKINGTTFQVIAASGLSVPSGASLGISSNMFFTGVGSGVFKIQNDAANAGVRFDLTTDGTLKLRDRNTGNAGTGNLDIGAKLTTYNQVNTAGNGIGTIVAYGDVAAATNTGTASIATFTPGADGTFQVGCNILITTATAHSFSCDVTYTDEGNTARTMVLPVVQLAGTFVTTGLITNVTGAGPYESPTMTIRVKASTAITVRTSAGGTFTTVVYNARGFIAWVS